MEKLLTSSAKLIRFDFNPNDKEMVPVRSFIVNEINPDLVWFIAVAIDPQIQFIFFEVVAPRIRPRGLGIKIRRAADSK